MTPGEQRIVILEFMGWTELTRGGRRGLDGPVLALRGTSPEGIKGRLAPNPTMSLDSVRQAELKFFKNHGSALDLFENLAKVMKVPNVSIGLPFAEACQRAKALVLTIQS